MKIYHKSKSKNYIVSVAIGERYFKEWKKYAFYGWDKYCKKNDIGLIVFEEELISKSNKEWKKPNWQKLLIGPELKKLNFEIDNVCFLDIDIIINHISSPNIFNFYNPKTFGLISQVKNIDVPLDLTLRSIAFNRNYHYSKKYPLDSALFMTPKQIFKFHNFKQFDDYACTGVFLFNLKNHGDLLLKWYYKYSSDYKSITTGEEPILNYEIQNYKKITWLDYKFQALWLYEMAWKYPFLYDLKSSTNQEILKCIEASLTMNYFLHFPGAWNEGKMWLNNKILKSKKTQTKIKKFSNYMEKKVSGKPKGIIKP